MAAPIRVDLFTVLAAVKQRLIRGTRAPAERVRMHDPDDADRPSPPGEFVLFLWPGDEQSTLFVGAGRLDTRDTVRLAIDVNTRLATDTLQDSEAWLKEHLGVRRRVQDVLYGDWPEDALSNVITDRPISPAGASAPRKDRRTSGWGNSRVWCDITYIVLLNAPATLL